MIRFEAGIHACARCRTAAHAVQERRAPLHGWGAHPFRLAMGLAALLSLFPFSASAQQVVWAQDTPTGESAFFEDTDVDPEGNTFLVGSFGDQVTLGAGGSNPLVLTSASGSGSFVAKFAPDGDLIWARRITDGNGGVAQVAADGSGNFYLSGNFSGGLTLGTGARAVTLSSIAGQDVFLAKFDGSGALLWARSAGGEGGDFALALALDAAGNAVLGGQFRSSATFGAEGPAPAVISFSGSTGSSGFLATYSSAGEFRWARSLGGAVARAVALGDDGRASVSGSFYAEVVLGEGTRSVTLTPLPGDFFDRNIYLAQYDAAGELNWAHGAGSPRDASVAGLAVDAQGNLFQSGSYEDSLRLGPGPSPTQLPGSARSKNFLAKYTPQGALIWARRTTGGDAGGEEQYNTGLAVDAVGNAYIRGTFAYSIGFAPGEPNETNLLGFRHGNNVGNRWDVYLAKYASSGALIWARVDGGNDIDLTGEIAVGADFSVYGVGRSYGVLTFGTDEPNETTVGRVGERVPHLVKFGASAAPVLDSDGDGIADRVDNCPSLANADQRDANRDGFGDVCVPLGTVDRRAQLGRNPVIGRGSRVERGVVLGADALLDELVWIERDSTAGTSLQVGRGAHVGRDVRIGDRVQIGAGVAIDRGARIGSDVVIEDGAVVGRDAVLEDGALVRRAAVLGRDTVLGTQVQIGEASSVGRGSRLDAGAVISARVVLADRVQLGARVQVGMETLIGEQCSLGTDAGTGARVVLESRVRVAANAFVAAGMRLRRGQVYP